MRGEWIEMFGRDSKRVGKQIEGLSPCGESGLKYADGRRPPAEVLRLSPCGESGLKLLTLAMPRTALTVSPRSGRVD